MKELITILGAGAALYIWQAQKFLASYSIVFLSAKFDYQRSLLTGFTNIFFKIRFDVVNPTAFAGTLQSGALTIYYKDIPIAHIIINDKINILPSGKTTVEMPVSLKSIDVIKNAPDFYQVFKNGTLEFVLKGKLNFNSGTVTINKTYPIQLPV